ncbi:MAG: AAA family ATPase [Clostridia bacterium]|nr:AAA family ATPase [Clostridia bacterium]
MSNLIVVAGPQAVGKMTVAEKLKEKIGYSLMVNHDSIEVSKKIFDSSNIAWKELNGIIRENVFQIAIKNNVNMIFTFVIAFDMQEDVDYLNRLKNMFEASGGKFYFVELEADLETRLERNLTPHRLEEKKSKRDVEWSKKELLETMEKYRLNSNEGEKLFENQIKINNTNIEPEEVANMIIEKFNLN